MKILIAEASSHYKILEQLYHLLNKKCTLFFYIIKPKYFNYLEMFPSGKKANIRTENFNGVLFFFGLLWQGWKYDYINISTGPEGDHYTDRIRILGFYLCCFIYRKKIILTIRNISPYLPSAHGLFALIRRKAISYLYRFTFETATLMEEFSRRNRLSNVRLAVSYDRYPDTLNKIIGKHRPVTINKTLRIGLLGSIDKTRRDYGLVFEALRRLPKETRQNLEFVTMGECPDGENNPIINSLKQYVSVNCKKGILSEREFALRGMSCRIVMAPLSKTMYYGTLKGSGAIGDAVYLRRRMIIPQFVDPNREFGDFCLYYTEPEQLADIFLGVAKKPNDNIKNSVFTKYVTQKVYKSLVRDLGLSLTPNILNNERSPLRWFCPKSYSREL